MRTIFCTQLLVTQTPANSNVFLFSLKVSGVSCICVVPLQISLNFFFFSGCGFFAYESFKDSILAMNGALTKVNTEGKTVLTPVGGLVCGALAGASSQTVA